MFRISYDPAAQPERNDQYVYFLKGRSDVLIVQKRGQMLQLPHMLDQSHDDFAQIGSDKSRRFWVGELDGDAADSVQSLYNYTRNEAIPMFGDLPDGLLQVKLRETYLLLGDEVFWMLARAAKIYNWLHTHRFCGVCATPMKKRKNELALSCPNCGNTSYPHIAPAVIVSIEHGDKILMVKNRRNPASFYGLVAGFVEAGETIEEAVHREVMEEVNLKICNLRYVMSQPWPFPNSLMLAFTADYLSGELRIQEDELAEAQWFSFDEIPATPPRISVASRLVEQFVARKTGKL